MVRSTSVDARHRVSVFFSIYVSLIAALAIGALSGLAREAAAQNLRSKYESAERFLWYNSDSLALNDEVDPHWIDDSNRFWYERELADGEEFVLVDAEENTQGPAFDHARLADSLSSVTDETHKADDLPFDRISFVEDEGAIEFEVEDTTWRCSLTGYTCTERPEEEQPAGLSPDGKWVAFVRDHNLFVRSTESGREIQLTRDGQKEFGYGQPLRSLREMVQREDPDYEREVEVEWGPNSNKLVTYRLDQRPAKELAVVQSSPEEHFWPQHYEYTYPLPGETGLPLAEPVIFNIPNRSRTFVDVKPSPLLYTGGGPLLNWDDDGETLYYQKSARTNKRVRLLEVDASTGEARTIIEETSETYIDPYMSSMERVNGGEEIIWMSERDGWGHLYLYDGETGELKNQITEGEWVVRGIEYVDEENHQVYFSASGRTDGDPYFRSLYRIDFDGSTLTRLTPERADHSIDFSSNGDYFVDAYSRVARKPVTVLREASNGEVVRTVEEANTQRLRETGWKPPEPFRVKAADGETDIYGLMWRPTDFDPTEEYPVVEQIYTGPHDFHVPKTFDAFDSMAQSIAELGFVTIMVDGRGTGRRSKDFRLFSFQNLGGVTVDHVATIEQLAGRYDFIDSSRVGIYGHSAGGYDSAHALLTHPETYDVAVSSAGNHDQRLDKAWWNEMYMGYPVGEHYEKQSNVTLVSNLQPDQHLMLAHGEVDNNVPPSETLRMVDALIEADKDFDLLIMPNEFHGMSGHPYFIQERWDYFVEHLLGVTPPKGYSIKE